MPLQKTLLEAFYFLDKLVVFYLQKLGSMSKLNCLVS